MLTKLLLIEHFLLYIYKKTNRIFLSLFCHFFYWVKDNRKCVKYETLYAQDNKKGDGHTNVLINGRETQTQDKSLVDSSSLPLGHLLC